MLIAVLTNEIERLRDEIERLRDEIERLRDGQSNLKCSLVPTCFMNSIYYIHYIVHVDCIFVMLQL